MILVIIGLIAQRHNGTGNKRAGTSITPSAFPSNYPGKEISLPGYPDILPNRGKTTPGYAFQTNYTFSRPGNRSVNRRLKTIMIPENHQQR